MPVSPRPVKLQLMEQFARIGKALASPRQLEMLDLLCQGARTVEQLAEATRLSVASTSQHLQVLKRAHIVDGRKQGLYVVYSVADDRVCPFLRALQDFGTSRLAEVQGIVHDYIEARDVLSPLTPEDLLPKMSAGEVVVVDLRPAIEYRQGHLPGAISLPLPELTERLAELPKDAEIVAYCRGPYCVLAPAALETLQERGYRARRLTAGVEEWREQDLPIERADETPSR